MALKGGFFDSVDDDRIYSSDDFARCFENFIESGIVKGDGSGFKVTKGDGLYVNISPGEAWIKGHWVRNTEIIKLSLPINKILNLAHVAIVLRLNTGNDRTFITTCIMPTTEQSVPPLVRNETTYDLMIGYAVVNKNASTINSVVDSRSDANACGWAHTKVELDKDALYEVFNYWNNRANSDYEVYLHMMEEYRTQLEDLIGEETAGKLLNMCNSLEAKKLDKAVGDGISEGLVYQKDGKGVLISKSDLRIEMQSAAMVKIQKMFLNVPKGSTSLIARLTQGDLETAGLLGKDGHSNANLLGATVSFWNLNGDSEKFHSVLNDRASVPSALTDSGYLVEANTESDGYKCECKVWFDGIKSMYTNETAYDMVANNGKVLVDFIFAKQQMFDSFKDISPDIPSSGGGESGGGESGGGTVTVDGASKDIYGDTFITLGRADGSTVGKYSIAYGSGVVASSTGSRAYGSNSTASGVYAVAEGMGVKATGFGSHAEGMTTKATAEYSHAEGNNTTASGSCSHSAGNNTTAGYANQFVVGSFNDNKKDNIFEVGNGTSEQSSNAFEIDKNGNVIIKGTITAANFSGDSTSTDEYALKTIYADTAISLGRKEETDIGDISIAYGTNVTASKQYSHAEGDSTKAISLGARAYGYNAIASGNYSVADGNNTLANGVCSHAEGIQTQATGASSHAEGEATSAMAINAHAEGKQSAASGVNAHAEGQICMAGGANSHAEGIGCFATGDNSHANGEYTTAGYKNQTTIGYYNNNKEDNIFEIGNGINTARSNAFEVDKNGNTTIAGNITAANFSDNYASRDIYGDTSIVLGKKSGTSSVGKNSILYGEEQTITTESENSQAFGYSNAISNSYCASILGNNNIIKNGMYSHAIGSGNNIMFSKSFAIGSGNKVSSVSGYTFGNDNNVSGSEDGLPSFAVGLYNEVKYPNQTAIGFYNDNKKNNIFEIGNGSRDRGGNVKRSNALEVDKDGNLKVKGKITANGYEGIESNPTYCMPVGSIIPFGGSTPPIGFLICDGSEVSKTSYSDLYNTIGDTYGTATDETKFKLPDLRDKFVQGANNNLGTSKEAGLPNITGDVGYIKSVSSGSFYQGVNSFTGAFKGSLSNNQIDPPAVNVAPDTTLETPNPSSTIVFNASKSNSIYGNSNTVQPPSTCLNYIIKALKVSDTPESGPDVYSEEEALTNKTFLGKPVYRKLVNFGALPNASTKDIQHGISNIDFVTDISGIAKKVNGDFLPLPYLWKSSTEDASISVFANATKVTIMTLNDRTDTNAYVYLEYTKTTD